MKFTTHTTSLLRRKIRRDGLKRIGFIEGWSPRMMDAALSLKAAGLVEPVMLFPTREKFQKAQLPGGLEYIIIEEATALSRDVCTYYLDKRKGKESAEDAMRVLKTTPYFGASLVGANHLDGAIGGVHFASSEILRAAFKAIGARAGIKTISSIMIMHKEANAYLYADVSVNIEPSVGQLVDIAMNACSFAKSLDIKQRVAFLSFSTSGSAAVPQSLKIKAATDQFNANSSGVDPAVGEIQFDAAYDASIRAIKYTGASGFDGQATIFIFPDLNAANIGYKIAQRMGDWGAIGPILTGLSKPLNDLSRGATTADIKYTTILTALQAY